MDSSSAELARVGSADQNQAARKGSDVDGATDDAMSDVASEHEVSATNLSVASGEESKSQSSKRSARGGGDESWWNSTW